MILQQFNRAQKSYILYDAANSAFALIVRTTFAAMMFKTFAANSMSAGSATSLWGYVSSGAGIAAAFLCPTLGTIADAFGKKKLFMAIFLIAGLCSTLGLSLLPDGNATGVLVFYFLGFASYLCANSFYDSLLTETAKPQPPGMLSAVSFAFGYAGGAVAFILCLAAMFLFFKNSPVSGMRFSFALTAVWWWLLALPFFRNVREPAGRTEGKISLSSGLQELARTAKELKNYKNVLLYLISYFLYIDGVSTILLLAVPYGKDAGATDLILVITILALQFLAVPFTLLYGYLEKRFSTRKVLYGAIAVYVLIAALAGTLPFLKDAAWKLNVFFVCAFLIATTQGGIQSLSRSLFTRLIPPEKSAEFFGLYNIFGKFTTIVGPLLVGITTAIFGHSGFGMASLVLPFLCGAFLLSKVKIGNADDPV